MQQVLVDATQGRTIVDRDGNPVRVRVRPAQGLCMDLFCYADLNGTYYQAIKGKTNWLGTHPLAAPGWFKSYINQRGEQLRRIVHYFIAWAEFQSTCRGIMPDILILTVLATYNFNDDYRDDVALARTFEAVSNYVRSIVCVLNPININEELSARLTESQKSRFQEAVDEAANIASAAIVINDAHMVSKLWRKLLGTRFPLSQENIRTEFAPIQTLAAPWRLRRMCTWLQRNDRCIQRGSHKLKRNSSEHHRDGTNDPAPVENRNVTEIRHGFTIVPCESGIPQIWPPLPISAEIEQQKGTDHVLELPECSKLLVKDRFWQIHLIWIDVWCRLRAGISGVCYSSDAHGRKQKPNRRPCC